METSTVLLLGALAGCVAPDQSTTSDDVIIGADNLQDVGLYAPKAGSPYSRMYVNYYEPAVGRLTDQTEWCSGTMIGRDLFLTAGHCPHSGTVQMHYQNEYDATGNLVRPASAVNESFTVGRMLECGMHSWCGSSYNVKSGNERDFAILQLNTNAAGEHAGDKYGWRAIGTPDPALLVANHSWIAVIQHPGGEPKQVDTGFVYIWDGLNMDQNADSMPGSSGSAVLDDSGQIIALDDSQSDVDNYGPAMIDIRKFSSVLKGPIAGSTYQLVNAGDGGCADVPGASKSPGSLIGENLCKTSGYYGNQELRFEPQTDGSYTIVAHDAGLCLTIPNTYTTPGTRLVLSPCLGAINQRFTLVQSGGDGTSPFFSFHSQLASTACLSTTGSGGYVDVDACSGRAWWSFKQTARTYRLVQDATAEVLDMPSASTATGVRPQLFPAKGDKTQIMNQEWRLVPQTDGTLTIVQEYSHLCLDLTTSIVGTSVVQNKCGGSTSQHWRLATQANNHVEFVNAASGTCMDLGNGFGFAMPCTASTSQTFALVKAVN